jgi:RNA polymerase sigma-70 factor (ECF subfamily)
MRDSAAVLRALGALDDDTLASLKPKLDAVATRFENLDAAALAAALSRRAPKAELASLRVDEVLLAEACLANDAAALRELDALLAEVVRTLRHRASATEVDELSQQLRIRLLVPTGEGKPKLELFAARGSLKGFLRVVALNLLNRQQADRKEESDSALVGMPNLRDWESGIVRLDQQQQFRDAFQRAVSALTVRQRSLLRMNLLDGLSIDELAPLYGAHRSSLARWLAEAKEALEAETRKQVATALKLSPDEVERLLVSAQQGFQLSLNRALRESIAPSEF